MAGKLLDVFKGHALVEQVGNRRSPKRVASEDLGRESRVLEPSLDHAEHVLSRHADAGEPFGLPVCRSNRHLTREEVIGRDPLLPNRCGPYSLPSRIVCL